MAHEGSSRIEGGSASAYEAFLSGLTGSDGGASAPHGRAKSCVAGVALLDGQGCCLYQRRLDPKLSCGGDGLVSDGEGRDLVAAVKGLTEDGLCRRDRLSCSGVWYRVFGGTPVGIYAVGPRRYQGMIVRALPRVGYLLVLYRRPHLAQEVVPHVEKFIDKFYDEHGFR